MLKTRWVMFALSLPTALVAYLLGVLAMVCWLARAPRFQDGLVLSFEWRPWVAERWKYSTTLFRTVFYRPGIRTEAQEPTSRVERHEHVHVRQMEDEAVKGLIIGVILVIAGVHPILGLVVWALWPSTLLVNYVGAAARWGFSRSYRDSEHERSAYAQTDLIRPGTEGKCWLDVQQK